MKYANYSPYLCYADGTIDAIVSLQCYKFLQTSLTQSLLALIVRLKRYNLTTFSISLRLMSGTPELNA